MSKYAVIGFACGLCAGAGAVLLYLHRKSLVALVKGKELPEAPEACPFFKGEPETDIADIENEVEDVETIIADAEADSADVEAVLAEAEADVADA